ncbi:ferredoxin reductase [Corynebacterium sp. 335C]
MTLLDRVRGALTGLSTPLLPDDYTCLLHPLWSKRELRGQIVSVTRQAADVADLVIRRGPGVPADFRPGQHIGIGVRVDGRFVWRSYSLTNAPDADPDGRLRITVKAQHEGRLSRHLVANAKPGTVIRLAAPAGDFHLPDPTPAKLLFITAGSGITPVISMLRHLDRRHEPGTGPDVVHLHSVRDDGGMLFGGYLRDLAARRSRYRLTVRRTAEEGRLGAGDVVTHVPDLADRVAYACGPSAMLDELEEAIPGIRTERFTLDRGATGAQGGRVTIPGRAEIEVDGATTILEAGEKAGVQLPYGCRMGICATCVQQLADGHARDIRTGETHGAGERIRVCVCVPAGDLALEA